MGAREKGEEEMEEHILLTILGQTKDPNFFQVESRCLWREAKAHMMNLLYILPIERQ